MLHHIKNVHITLKKVTSVKIKKCERFMETLSPFAINALSSYNELGTNSNTYRPIGRPLRIRPITNGNQQKHC